MSVKWITHKNVRVLYADLRGDGEEQVLRDIDAIATAAQQSAERFPLLLNVEGILVGPKILSHGKNMGKSLVVAKSSRTAAVGVAGPKKALVDVYNAFSGANVQVFATETEALDWLVQ